MNSGGPFAGLPPADGRLALTALPRPKSIFARLALSQPFKPFFEVAEISQE